MRNTFEMTFTTIGSAASLIVSFWVFPSGAATGDRNLLVKEKPTCAVRLTSSTFDPSKFGADAPGFCTGTLTDSTTLVTAAHCLSDLGVSNKTSVDQLAGGRFVLGFGTSEVELPIGLESGPRAAYAGPLMNLGEQRQVYAERKQADIGSLADDLVVVHLKTPIPGVSGCPRLPTANDCAEFKGDVLEPKEPAVQHLRADVFLSQKIKKLETVNTRYTPVPQPVLFQATVRMLSLEPQDSSPNPDVKAKKPKKPKKLKPSKVDLPALPPPKFLKATFLPASTAALEEEARKQGEKGSRPFAKRLSQLSKFELERGDSGTGLIWNSASGDVLIAVQSGAYNDQKGHPTSSGAFALVCPQLQNPRWAEVVGRGQEQQAAGNGASKGAAAAAVK